ncbi:MAG: CRISPR-associated endonuclease Cas2 [Anaerolineales bacterium]|nr:CRISPR-associated endonuclease Cas2 [Anaerolineales bacterium]
MMVLICYDVDTTTASGQKRLRKVAKVCEDYGQRVQNSVFECLLDAAKYKQLKHALTTQINKEKDSLRFYHLGDNWKPRVEHIGAKASLDLEGPLIA